MQTSKASIRIPEQFTGVNGLGAAQGVYTASNSNRWVSAMLGVLLLVSAALTGIYGFFDASVQVARYGPVLFDKTFVMPLIIAALLFLAGLLLSINAALNWNKCVVLYEQGLAYNDQSGVQTWTWREVEWFYTFITKRYTSGIYSGTSYVYTLRKANGARLVLDNKFKQIELIGNSINKKVAPLQYERLIQSLRSEQTVTLGKLSISSENISINKKSYSWGEVENVGLRRGYISIHKKNGGWFSGASAPVHDIPNLDALLAVVEHYATIKTG
jgi:hypothetical protein